MKLPTIAAAFTAIGLAAGSAEACSIPTPGGGDKVAIVFQGIGLRDVQALLKVPVTNVCDDATSTALAQDWSVGHWSGLQALNYTMKGGRNVIVTRKPSSPAPRTVPAPAQPSGARLA